MALILSTAIDTFRVPSHFSCLAVRIHKEIAAIEEASHEVIEICTAPGSKERARALHRHSNSFGNFYAISFPEFDTEKLKIYSKILELLWIHDDAIEIIPHTEAVAEHEILRQALHREYDSNPDSGKTVGVKKQLLRDIRDGMLALDPVDAPAALEAIDIYLREYDSSEENFKTVEEYLPYRIMNAGYRLFSSFILWGMGIHLTDEESKVVEEFVRAVVAVTSLSNDYFSWKMERLQTTDRVRNAVPILMRQYSLQEKEAKSLLRGMVIDEEERMKRLRMALESREDFSNELKRYMQGQEFAGGGHAYWSATCPRYNQPLEEGDRTLEK